MRFEEKIIVKSSPEKVFFAYENVSEWSTWDPEVQSSSIKGKPMVGAKGKLKPTKGPEANIEITEVTKNESFTVISKLPLCTMTFEHKLTSLAKDTEVVHRVIFTGILSPIFGCLIGSGIRKGLPSTLQGLKKTIEAKGKQSHQIRSQDTPDVAPFM